MIVKHNIKTYSISWISSSYDKDSATGIIDNYYLPESVGELQELCAELQERNESFRVIGHTSNIYFLPNTSIKHLISVRKINKWRLEGEFLECDCGVNVKTLAKAMVQEGYEGFAGLIDLPGTVGGAIYGNASVGTFSITKLLDTIVLLNGFGQIEKLAYEDMNFQRRSSALKRDERKGIILSCTLKVTRGVKEKERELADNIHKWRLQNQPGPLNNLGTTVLLGTRSIYGIIAFSIAQLFSFKYTSQNKDQLVLKIMGKAHLAPYLFGNNRFIWKDSKAHSFFADYLAFINKVYKNPKLEIEVF